MDRIVWDKELSGFGERTRDTGKKRFIVQYRIGKQQRRMTLAAGITREQARKIARKVLARVELGEDPQGEKKAARTASIIGSFKDVAERFIARQKETRRESTANRTELYLTKYVTQLHALKVDEIRPSQIAPVLADIAKRHGKVSADRVRATLSAMFAWAYKEGLCGDDFTNPIEGTGTKSEYVPIDRPLTDAEIKAIWNAAGGDDFGRIVKLLLLTGARRTEIASLRWEEIGDDLITIPGERTKNGRKFEVPLTAASLAALPERGTGFVFGRRGTGFSGFSKAKKELDDKLTGVKPWRLHDIRHTVSTRLHDDLGVEPHIVEAVLNHVSGHKAGVAGRYNHAAYRDQKCEALEAWAKRIAVITGKNVVDIGKGRKRKAG
jgi:integrase